MKTVINTILYLDMSWWEPSAFSNLASQAFKTAQSKIDKVLDIQEETASKITGMINYQHCD